MHLCVSNLTIIASDNGSAPGRHQAIIWINAGILLIGPLGTNFSEILIEIITFSLKKMCLKVLSAKWRPFCLGLNVLKLKFTLKNKIFPLIIKWLLCFQIGPPDGSQAWDDERRLAFAQNVNGKQLQAVIEFTPHCPLVLVKLFTADCVGKDFSGQSFMINIGDSLVQTHQASKIGNDAILKHFYEHQGLREDVKLPIKSRLTYQELVGAASPRFIKEETKKSAVGGSQGVSDGVANWSTWGQSKEQGALDASGRLRAGSSGEDSRAQTATAAQGKPPLPPNKESNTAVTASSHADSAQSRQASVASTKPTQHSQGKESRVTHGRHASGESRTSDSGASGKERPGRGRGTTVRRYGPSPRTSRSSSKDPKPGPTMAPADSSLKPPLPRHSDGSELAAREKGPNWDTPAYSKPLLAAARDNTKGQTNKAPSEPPAKPNWPGPMASGGGEPAQSPVEPQDWGTKPCDFLYGSHASQPAGRSQATNQAHPAQQNSTNYRPPQVDQYRPDRPRDIDQAWRKTDRSDSDPTWRKGDRFRESDQNRRKGSPPKSPSPCHSPSKGFGKPPPLSTGPNANQSQNISSRSKDPIYESPRYKMYSPRPPSPPDKRPTALDDWDSIVADSSSPQKPVWQGPHSQSEPHTGKPSQQGPRSQSEPHTGKPPQQEPRSQSEPHTGKPPQQEPRSQSEPHTGKPSQQGPRSQSEPHTGNPPQQGPRSQSEPHTGKPPQQGPRSQSEPHTGNPPQQGPRSQCEPHTGKPSQQGPRSQSEPHTGKPSQQGPRSQSEPHTGKPSQQGPRRQSEPHTGKPSQQGPRSQSEPHTGKPPQQGASSQSLAADVGVKSWEAEDSSTKRAQSQREMNQQKPKTAALSTPASDNSSAQSAHQREADKGESSSASSPPKMGPGTQQEGKSQSPANQENKELPPSLEDTSGPPADQGTGPDKEHTQSHKPQDDASGLSHTESHQQRLKNYGLPSKLPSSCPVKHTFEAWLSEKDSSSTVSGTTSPAAEEVKGGVCEPKESESETAEHGLGSEISGVSDNPAPVEVSAGVGVTTMVSEEGSEEADDVRKEDGGVEGLVEGTGEGKGVGTGQQAASAAGSKAEEELPGLVPSGGDMPIPSEGDTVSKSLEGHPSVSVKDNPAPQATLATDEGSGEKLEEQIKESQTLPTDLSPVHADQSAAVSSGEGKVEGETMAEPAVTVEEGDGGPSEDQTDKTAPGEDEEATRREDAVTDCDTVETSPPGGQDSRPAGETLPDPVSEVPEPSSPAASSDAPLASSPAAVPSAMVDVAPHDPVPHTVAALSPAVQSPLAPPPAAESESGSSVEEVAGREMYPSAMNPTVTPPGPHSVPPAGPPMEDFPALQVPIPQDCCVRFLMAHIVSPASFYIHLVAEGVDSIVDGLMKELRKHFTNDNKGAIWRRFMEPEFLSSCVARYSEDNELYRALVTSIGKDEQQGQVQVFFVDFGNTEWTSYENIFPLPPEFRSTPPQALHCCLAGVTPPAADGKEWSEKAIQAFQDMTGYEKTLLGYVIDPKLGGTILR